MSDVYRGWNAAACESAGDIDTTATILPKTF